MKLPDRASTARIISDTTLASSEQLTARMSTAGGRDEVVLHYLVARSVAADLKTFTVELRQPPLAEIAGEPARGITAGKHGDKASLISLSLPKDAVPPAPGEDVFVTFRETSRQLTPDSVKLLKPASALLTSSR